ncbi:LysR family transcriptional regulator [Catenisphaera adipataccumulans]|uniref:DNA-binding transcriptional LysR family regulator n=1 Tax=Catenisphaera adipataccumulans TaxID=700500 RepID=A0A7W8CW11_9FIRM|nr:LysR family transcriptional regulator [Catenisphaera adipataccumulans]MBB5182652.1 DNA-binding transcriptional LysR family regulator [Catenisphaera adipataccumulans]
MNTKQIDYILELAETLNFNRAAENLYISQPTLTYQIHSAEQEIGFTIFDRSNKKTSITPAGLQFVASLRGIRAELRKAIEQGQNYSSIYRENIRIVLPIRSALYFLPQAIREISDSDSGILISPPFDWDHGIDSFLQGEQDILFAIKDEVSHIPDIRIHDLFDSRIYLVVRKDDLLAKKSLIEPEDLDGRTLMVGGPSQAPLRQVQQRMIETQKIHYFNSDDHDTSLTNVAAGRAIVLSPGFLNDHNEEFCWIPFDCEETIPCVLCTHASDNRALITNFIEIIQSIYHRHPDFAV